jgi:(R)-2-hydroxyacyl-CoA dehydratese activating ATPase
MNEIIKSNHKNKTKFYLGIDIGSVSSKAVLISNNSIVSSEIIYSRGKLAASADELTNRIMAAGISRTDIVAVAATGYGANCVSKADLTANDITCNAKGMSYLNPAVKTVVDLGGQFSKAFRIDSRGLVSSFVQSEKCAAGSGRLLELIARVLRVDINDLGSLSLQSKNVVSFTTGCAVFNESETISRISEGALKEDIAAGILRSLAGKVQSLVERLGFEPELGLIGGGALNIGLVRSINNILQTKAYVPHQPQFVAALGAALIAEEKGEKTA